MSSLNDEPTLNDQLQRSERVRALGKELIKVRPPKVYGVHGEWGSGKTSFLCQLQHYLSGSCPRTDGKEMPKPGELWPGWQQPEDVTTVWFEAWRYQHEKVPVVALLQEIRTQLTTMQKTREEIGKVAAVTAKSVLLSLETVTQVIGIKASAMDKAGVAWEQQHRATALATNEIRDLLENAVSTLTGEGRLVVLIDDLDRCEPRAAYQLLEGLKIYLNLPNCLFVLAMDQRLIERYLANEMAMTQPQGSEDPEEKRQARHLSREYLEKICQDIIHLPLLRKRATLLDHYLQEEALNVPGPLRAELKRVVETYKILPANPRKIKAYANALTRYFRALPPDFQQGNTFGEKAEFQRRAGELVLFTALYQNHPPIFQQLEKDGSNFYEELLKFASGDRNLDHQSIEGLRPHKEGELDVKFPHPSEADVNQITKLIKALGQLPSETYQAFLKGD